VGEIDSNPEVSVDDSDTTAKKQFIFISLSEVQHLISILDDEAATLEPSP
jgi:hypothetical protein